MKLTLSDFFKLFIFLHVWPVKPALNQLANRRLIKAPNGVKKTVMIASVSSKLSADGRSAAQLVLFVT